MIILLFSFFYIIYLDKIICTSELKAENYVFALYFYRFALSLPRYEKDTYYSYINQLY